MKNRKNLKAELREILATTVLLRKGSRRQRLSLLSAIVATQADKALQGDTRAARAVVEIARECEVFDGSHQQYALDLTKLSDQELKALEKITAKSQILDRDAEEE